MFKKIRHPYGNLKKAESVISKNTACEGIIDTSESISIDGKFKGEIKTTADLLIEKNGRVEAMIQASQVFIEGSLNGNIVVQGKVELASGAKLFGDILVSSLVIKEGAVFNGNCNFQNTQCPLQINETVHTENETKTNGNAIKLDLEQEIKEEKPGC